MRKAIILLLFSLIAISNIAQTVRATRVKVDSGMYVYDGADSLFKFEKIKGITFPDNSMQNTAAQNMEFDSIKFIDSSFIKQGVHSYPDTGRSVIVYESIHDSSKFYQLVEFTSNNGPAGNNFEIQLNDNGNFGSSQNLKWNDSVLHVNNSNNSTYIGYESGQIKTRGGNESNNTGLGYRAGKGSGTNSAIGNTTIGYTSGENINGGDNNTLVGAMSGQSLQSGNSNVCIGQNSGSSNISGGNNTVIGQGAGESTTGSGNVFIGYNAGGQETGSNKLYISNSNTVTPLILGDFTTGIINITDVLLLTPRSTIPENGVLGMIYVNSIDGHIYFYNGTTWVQMDN